jgi:hypothetical protein
MLYMHLIAHRCLRTASKGSSFNPATVGVTTTLTLVEGGGGGGVSLKHRNKIA